MRDTEVLEATLFPKIRVFKIQKNLCAVLSK